MKIKTSELTGRALDWAVALAEGHKPPLLRVLRGKVALPQQDDPMWCDFLAYHEDWSQGGPIIEGEKISTWDADGVGCGFLWGAHKTLEHNHCFQQRGLTPLIAAMRCFVASKMGDEVEVPDGLV